MMRGQQGLDLGYNPRALIVDSRLNFIYTWCQFDQKSHLLHLVTMNNVIEWNMVSLPC